MNDNEKLIDQFLSNYDSEFVYFFNNKLVKCSLEELKDVYKKTHLHECYDSEDDRYGIIYDLMDYLEITSQLLFSIFNINKQEANNNSIFLFGLDIDVIEKILSIIHGDEKKSEIFIIRLKKYVEPTGLKKTDEILLYKK